MLQMWAKPAIAQAALLAVAQAARQSVRRLLPSLALLSALVGGGALAQTPPAAKPAPAAARTALSPGEAQGALAVLRDEKRRAELIATLDAIAKTAPEAAPAPAAEPAATPAAAAAPAKATINPDSVGAQLANRLSLILSAYAQQLTNSVQSVNDLPQLGQFFTEQAADPAARAAIVDAVLKLVAVFAAGLAADYGLRRLLKRLRETLLAWAPRRADPDADGTDAHPAVERRRRRFVGALAALRQLPYLFGRLLLDLLPVAAFAGVAMMLLGTALGQSYTARLVILQALEAYAYARAILALAGFLFSAETPRLRLVAVPDGAARFLMRWIRRIVIIGVTGWAVANFGELFGMQTTAQLALLKLFMLVIHVCLVVAVFQARAPVAHRLRARRTATGVWARLLTRFAEIWHWVAIFYIAALWLVWAVEVRNGYQRLLSFCAVTAAIVLGGRLLAVLLLGGLDRLRLSLADEREGAADRASAYYPVLRVMLNLLLWFGTAIALFEAWGFPVLFWLTAGGLGGRVLEAVRTIVVVVVLAVVGWEVMNAVIARHMAGLADSAQLARAGRLRTLMPLLRTSVLIVLVLIVGMTVLSAIGVNIAPLLAGAGVIGIAVGFGSQKLVQDLITGLFLLLENAMQVGDVVTVAGMTGTVESLTIRTIRLRALDGAVHLIPFSAVTTVTNQTRDYSYALLDVSIGLNEEPAPIEEVLRRVAAELRADPAYQSIVLADLDVLGVEKLTDLAWIMRVRLKTQPGSRWAVAREMNRRIKNRFDELAIESPFTSHKVLSRDPPPAPVAQAEEQAA